MSANPIIATHDLTTVSSDRPNADAPRLHLASELVWSDWKLGFATGLDAKPWRRTIPARNLPALQDAIAKARLRFELPDNAAVCSCYEAGRDGFWLHRQEKGSGVEFRRVNGSRPVRAPFYRLVYR